VQPGEGEKPTVETRGEINMARTVDWLMNELTDIEYLVFLKRLSMIPDNQVIGAMKVPGAFAGRVDQILRSVVEQTRGKEPADPFMKAYAAEIDEEIEAAIEAAAQDGGPEEFRTPKEYVRTRRRV
jgi:hypothetical protein